MSVVSVQPLGAPGAAPIAGIADTLNYGKNKALKLARDNPVTTAVLGGLLSGGAGVAAGVATSMYTAQDGHYFGKYCVDKIEPGDLAESASDSMRRTKTGFIQSCRDLYDREAYKKLKSPAMQTKIGEARARVCDGGDAEKKWNKFCAGTK